MSNDQYDAVYPLLHCDQGFKAWTAIPIQRSTNTMTTGTKTARELKQLDGWQGDARVFELSQPVAYEYDYESGEYKSQSTFVVVSAVDVMFSGPETYIFPCDANGEVLNWSELEGSFKGALDHERALQGAGFEVATSWVNDN